MAGLSLMAVVPLLAAFGQSAPPVTLGLGPHTVTGRVVTRSGSIPPRLAVWVHFQTDTGTSGSTCQLLPDGRFRAQGLASGTYIFSVAPTRDGPNDRPAGLERGFAVVTIRDADVDGVLIPAAPGNTVRGRIRFDEPQPGTARPTTILVHASLALTEWMGPSETVVATDDGTFQIPDVRGPRVFKFGMAISPGSYWVPSRVLLDGRDITNLPVDFATEPAGDLEVVFSQRPSAIVVRVEDVAGLPLSTCVMMVPHDPGLRRGWSTGVGVTQANERGRFYFTGMPAGDYFVSALKDEGCPPIHKAIESLGDVPSGATSTTVGQGATVRVIVSASTSARP